MINQDVADRVVNLSENLSKELAIVLDDIKRHQAEARQLEESKKEFNRHENRLVEREQALQVEITDKEAERSEIERRFEEIRVKEELLAGQKARFKEEAQALAEKMVALDKKEKEIEAGINKKLSQMGDLEAKLADLTRREDLMTRSVEIDRARKENLDDREKNLQSREARLQQKLTA